VLIAVCDGLKGLPGAITTTGDRTVVQQCIAHHPDVLVMPSSVSFVLVRTA
jgi:transposase-like protein